MSATTIVLALGRERMDKPRQGFWGLWNISFGFFGIQLAFGLQNANISRIFQTLGSDVESLAFLWMAGPVTGLLVQPLIGYFSDRGWSRFGRRRPYFFAGALCCGAALFGMPYASALLIAAVCLWVIDASLNVAMEPFRAFVADMLSPSQHASGYAFQTAFIGAGAVLGSLAPKLITMAGVANTAAPGVVPDSVRYAFMLGAAAMVLAVLWTVLTTREYSPAEMRAFNGDALDHTQDDESELVTPRHGLWWLSAGALLLLAVWQAGLDKQLYVLGGALAAFGLAQMVTQAWNNSGKAPMALSHILSDLAQMPPVMRQLALAQFFTWIALFIMWIYTTPVVTQYIFHTTDASSKAFNDGSDWVGVLFSVYNGVAALAAFILPVISKRIGAAKTHALCLLIGAASYASILVIRDANLLMLPMVGIGITWASILCMPYVILARVLPQHKLGIYMGIFNFFIVIPQLLTAAIMGAVIKHVFPGAPIWTMLVAASVMTLAALAMLRVRVDQAAQ
jgi:maltose/moltooligosaccharide transporter